MSLNFMINLLTGKFNKKSKLSEEDNVNDMKKILDTEGSII